ncbi:hypothetical protein QYM36_002375 [Artemia franciscana]|uniref:C2H2-type domain-containing protein n=1 Tax=Artemia franciscana TaxID=6661 RepID=A0AA88I8W3_ARTSF|nr:hypothetical protein QYM36_002375 [Artemia franciscana]
MDTPMLLGITAVKQEVEDTSSNEDKDIFGSTHPMLFMKHEAKPFAISPGISGNCQQNANHVKLEPNIAGDEVLLLAASSDNDMSEQERGLTNMSDLSSLSLKKEMNLNYRNERPSHIYDMGKQEASHIGKKPFECDICNKRFARSINRLHKPKNPLRTNKKYQSLIFGPHKPKKPLRTNKKYQSLIFGPQKPKKPKELLGPHKPKKPLRTNKKHQSLIFGPHKPKKPLRTNKKYQSLIFGPHKPKKPLRTNKKYQSLIFGPHKPKKPKELLGPHKPNNPLRTNKKYQTLLLGALCFRIFKRI